MPPEINAFVADARRRLCAAGIAQGEASLDARLLAQLALGWDRTRLLTHGEEPPPDGFPATYASLVVRRANREPLAYITGSREFWNLDIEVTPAVLIPRPETELLIEASLEHFDRRHRLRILDVCTGSGCLAVGLGREFTDAWLVASDRSSAAVGVARRNVARHGLASRVPCVVADLCDGLSATFDLIVSNPPYVPTVDAPLLQPEVRLFEPPEALFAGEDGLQLVRRLVADAAQHLAVNGLLIFEFGVDQQASVEAVVASARELQLIDVKHDLQDIPRTAVVRRVG
jgi:release factor glutamine methyltransferase